jgi:hypothetical protein
MRAFKLALGFVSLASALPNPAAKSYAEKMNIHAWERCRCFPQRPFARRKSGKFTV